MTNGSRSREQVFLGDLALDVLVRRHMAIQPDTDTPAAINLRSGGSAANAATWYAHARRAASLVDSACVFIGCVGNDPAGVALVSELQPSGVTPQVTAVDGVSTACIVVMVGPDGRRDMISDRGAGLHLSLTDNHRATLSACGGLHLTLYSLVASATRHAALDAARLATNAGATVSLDLSSLTVIDQIGRDNVRTLISTIQPAVVLANQSEYMAVLPPARRDAVSCPLLIVHDIAGVSVMQRGSAAVRVPAVHVAPELIRDTTGAGDALAAGLLFGLRSGLAVDDAGRFAVELAAQAVQIVGGRPQTPNRTQEQIAARSSTA